MTFLAMDPPLRSQSPHESNSNITGTLRDLGLLELVEHDPRASFILDAASPCNGIYPVYQNSALVGAKPGTLLDAILEKENTTKISGDDAGSFQQFKDWIFQPYSTSYEPFTLCDYTWRRCLIASRWVVISGLSINACTLDGETKTDGDILSKRKSKSKFRTFDWTNDLPPAKLSPHVVSARNIDWASTPLGPMSSWSPQLRSNASLIMQDPWPAVGFYGPELIMIYNEAYIELLGDLHPCMGHCARTVLAPIWHEHFEPVIQKNMEGETVDTSNTEIPLTRNGYVEETYFSTRFIPIFDSEGATIGHYEPVVETVSPKLHFPFLALNIEDSCTFVDNMILRTLRVYHA
jgi:hypothetical protein